MVLGRHWEYDGCEAYEKKYDGGDSDRALAVGEDEASSVMGTVGGGYMDV
jgi:hypothetical protein